MLRCPQVRVFASASALVALALVVACTAGGELPPSDPVAPAPEPAPEVAPPIAAAPVAPGSVTAAPTAQQRLHPANTVAELFGLTGDDAGLVLAVGGDGLVVRSEDHGQTWHELTTPTTHRLAAAWRGPNGTLFAVGDAGTIVRSRDRGRTWELRSSGVTADLEHLAGNSAEVVVAGAGGTIVRSRDDGDTWTPVVMPVVPERERPAPSRRYVPPEDRNASPPPHPDDVLRGMFSPDEDIRGLGAPRPGELLIALRRLVWQRLDDRSDWRVLARAVDRRDSFGELWVGETHWAVTGRNVGRDDPRFFVGIGGTGDPGYISRWSEIRTRLISPPQVIGAPRPGGLAPLLYLAGDGYSVHWSDDGAATWDGSEQSAIMQSPYSLAKRALWVAGDGTVFAAGSGGAIMRSSDGARTWQLIDGGNREPLFGGALGPDGSIFTALAYAVLRGRGERWDQLSPASKLPIGGGREDDAMRGLVRCCTDVWVADDGAIVAAGNGLLWRSQDDGRTWKKVHDDDPRWDCCGSLWGDERGVFGVDRDFVLASIDRGKTWKRTDISAHSAKTGGDRLDITGHGDHLLLVGGPGVIIHSSDRGRTWKRRTSPTNEPLYAGMVMSTPTGLLALAVGEHGTLVRSTDAVDWQTVSLPTTMRLLGVHGDASRGELYIVGESGLLRSRDAGLTWTVDPAVHGSLRSVFGDGRGQVVVTGERGLVLRL